MAGILLSHNDILKCQCPGCPPALTCASIVALQKLGDTRQSWAWAPGGNSEACPASGCEMLTFHSKSHVFISAVRPAGPAPLPSTSSPHESTLP